ncbi:hypothetical protein AYO45_05240 [Gammaproteobacteria bacterium SCGC AG-212-F23]|nr:hypothetical protein AYO45_05240 [Gammaproteobacteria bacterium SCGC AG-212-F23]
MMLRQSIDKLMQQENLNADLCQQAMADILDDQCNNLQAAAFLTLLRSKKETAEEFTALLHYFKQQMLPIATSHKTLDIVGTGGDCKNTVNISTGSAILAASCGIKIAKHGGRAVSSAAGSADVLEALGININLTPEKISQCIDEVGIGFCYAPLHHPALLKLKTLRKQLNIPTILNLIAPLINPAQPDHIILGVYDTKIIDLIAKTLQLSGTTRSIIAHAHGIDEISCIGPATLLEVTKTAINKIIIDPKQFGLPYCSIEDLQGGSARENAQLLLAAFSGKNQAIANTCILNAALALYLYGKYNTIEEGIKHAKENINDGSAFTLINRLKELSHD